ncbi:hypothetical protein ECANGB1_1113 [Enterospora canceri]|uniref:Uncharacterized protein n=1 Tax=Enterospora canceri TaxID=1081671 RepID=A0A1Y1S6S1_9MICR|nr:hypothetical protein ECANGB1_1113 [Enterospora canceri]
MTKKSTDFEDKKNNNRIGEEKRMTMLEIAIETNDEDYITEYTKNGDISELKELTKKEKIRLAKMVVKYMKEEYKTKAVILLNEIVRDVGAVDGVLRGLIDVQIDFNKLIYLKGKIDYLKHQAEIEHKNDVEPEAEFME